MDLAGGTEAADEFIQRLNLPELQAGLASWFDTEMLVDDNAVQAGLIVLALAVGPWLGLRLPQLLYLWHVPSSLRRRS